MIKIAILGFGIVGSGVYEVIRKNMHSIERKAGDVIDIGYILDIRDFKDHEEASLFTTDYNKILTDPEISIIVEVMGGLNPAYEYTKAALLAGKSVITSNKELVATHGAELLALAAEKSINYFFEASVGGGIPIIRPLNQCLAANEITQIIGILNGTTNYILTKMIKNGQSFEDALADAQQKGYAERNPSADVDGHDACRKICILASLAFGRQVDYNGILTEGITKITLEDIKYAEAIGYVVKLIGYAKSFGENVLARVSPMLVAKDHPLAGVEDVFNSILVKGDSIGDVMFYGRGAGKLPTASAVVADVIEASKSLDTNKRFMWVQAPQDFIVDAKEASVKLFVRMKTQDKCKASLEVIDKIGDIEEIGVAGIHDELAFITQTGKEQDLLSAIESVGSIHSFIRILEAEQE